MVYDFERRFPYPTEAALAEGFLAREGVDAWSETEVIEFHNEVVRMLVTSLYIVDFLADCRRRGLDPRTGRRGRTGEKREAAALRSLQEIQRIGSMYRATLTQYASVFGYDAERDMRAHVIAAAKRVKREQAAIDAGGQYTLGYGGNN